MKFDLWIHNPGIYLSLLSVIYDYIVAHLLFRRHLLIINLCRILPYIIEWEHERNASGRSDA